MTETGGNPNADAPSPAPRGDAAAAIADQARLIAALRDPALFGADRVDLVETHISWILLTGRHAWKIKKAVDLGFLDFSTLALRKHYCEEELRLNRRFAPDLYLEVVAITGDRDAPRLGGEGPVLEYALKMREFPQEALLSHMLRAGRLDAAHVDALASTLAELHERLPAATPDNPYGTTDVIGAAARANFDPLRALGLEGPERSAIDRLARWTEERFAAARPLLEQRRAAGRVRECHGDLHLANIVWIDGRIMLFDCIEFDPELRWIDVMSELAFTLASLMSGGGEAWAHRLLNGYLEHTGDYEGLEVLDFYLVYRSLVRAKIAALRAMQAGAGAEALAECRRHLQLADAAAERRRGALIITSGLSGSGKTTLTQPLLERIGAIRIRTDVERKRLHGLTALQRTGSAPGEGLYTEEATRRSYAHVRAIAAAALRSGRTVIVDGAFLKRWQRSFFRELADSLGVPFLILAFEAPEATLRERLVARARAGRDASDATVEVLERQLRTREPFTPEEEDATVHYDASRPLTVAQGAEAWSGLLRRLGTRT